MKAYLIEVIIEPDTAHHSVVFADTSVGALNKFLTKHTEELNADDLSINTEVIDIIQ